MVDRKIVGYLKEGKKRGFSFDRLKKELVNGGFDEEDIEEAGKAVFAKKEKDKIESKIMTMQNSGTQIKPEKIGLFSKIGKSLANPRELFELTQEEGIWPAWKFYWFILLAPFIIFSIFILIFIKIMIELLSGLFLSTSPGAFVPSLIVILFFAVLFFVIAPIFSLVWICVQHLFVKIFGGKGKYSDTYKAIIYASSPAVLFGWIPIINIGAAVWTFVLAFLGISINHKISKTRAFLALITPGLIFAVFLLLFYYIY